MAEAGFEHGYESLCENSSYTGQTNVSLGGGKFSTSVANGPTNGTLILTSTGYVTSGAGILCSRTVSGEISMSAITPLLNYGLVSNGAINMSGPAPDTITSSPTGGEGDVYTNSNCVMNTAGVVVKGNLTSGGNGNLHGRRPGHGDG